MFQIGRCCGDRLDRSHEGEKGGDGKSVDVTTRPGRGYSQNPRGPCPTPQYFQYTRCVYSRVDGGGINNETGSIHNMYEQVETRSNHNKKKEQKQEQDTRQESASTEGGRWALDTLKVEACRTTRRMRLVRHESTCALSLFSGHRHHVA